MGARRGRRAGKVAAVGEPVYRAELLARGVTDKELWRMRRDGRLVTLRRGAYAVPEDTEPTADGATHRLTVRAAMRSLADDAVASQVSAAVLFGLPVWAICTSRVHVTRARRTGGRRAPSLHVHALSLDRDEIVTVDGIAVTAPGRTLVDLGRSVSYQAAVAVADAALRAGLLDGPELRAAAARAVGRPGAPQARRVADFADARSESVGESRSRVALVRAGVPSPVPQWEVRSRTGVLLGRSDFGWPELRTLGEFDGRAKYGRLLRPGESAGDAVFREKQREDALRAEGWSVVRWTWDDLSDFAPVVVRLRRAFGWAQPPP